MISCDDKPVSNPSIILAPNSCNSPSKLACDMPDSTEAGDKISNLDSSQLTTKEESGRNWSAPTTEAEKLQKSPGATVSSTPSNSQATDLTAAKKYWTVTSV